MRLTSNLYLVKTAFHLQSHWQPCRRTGASSTLIEKIANAKDVLSTSLRSIAKKPKSWTSSLVGAKLTIPAICSRRRQSSAMRLIGMKIKPILMCSKVRKHCRKTWDCAPRMHPFLTVQVAAKDSVRNMRSQSHIFT